MSRAAHLALVITLWLAAAPLAAAATLHVAPNGSDANPGTADHPFKTIQKAADAARAGDTVLVADGSYPERIALRGTGANAAPITVKAANRRAAQTEGFALTGSYLRVEGFKVVSTVARQSGIDLRGDHNQAIDNYLVATRGLGISCGGHDNRVARNLLEQPQMGIAVSGTANVVEENEVHGLKDYGVFGDCDYSRFFGEGHIIRNNHFHGVNFSEIGRAHVDGFQTFAVNGEIAKNITIEGNIVNDCHQVIMAEGVAGSHDGLVFRNNILIRGRAWGLCIYGYQNVTAVNNIFYNIGIHGAGFHKSKTDDTPSTAVFQNNIFYNGGSLYWADEHSTLRGGHNIIFGQRRGNARLDPTDLENIDPLLVDPANGDFHLKAGSPAIDAGADVGLTHDKDGQPRPQGRAPDIGPYEYAPPR